MIRFACQLVLLILVGRFTCLAESARPDGDPVAAARELAAKIVTAKSSTGRFSAVGEDRRLVYDFITWEEDLGERYAAATGLTLPVSRSPLIRVFFSNDEAAPQSISITSRREDRVLTHSVTVVNYESTDAETLMEAICFCLTQSVVDSVARLKRSDRGDFVVPGWLTQGIAQNLYPGHRKRNSERMLRLWKQGKMLSLRALLTGKDLAASDENVRMAHGLLVGWLISFGRDSAIIPKIITDIAVDGKIEAEKVTAMIEGEISTDAMDGWDRWMLLQDRTVYLPGGTSMKDLAWLKAQLLLYPSDFGISDSEDLPQKLSLSDLIDLKKDDGIKGGLKARCVELQLKAAGKSEEFHGVIDAYCKFLNGVVEEKMDWRLRGYLEEAEKKLRDFEIRTRSARLKEKGALEREQRENEKD